MRKGLIVAVGVTALLGTPVLAADMAIKEPAAAAVGPACGSGPFNGVSLGIDAGLAQTTGSNTLTPPLAAFPTSVPFSFDTGVYGPSIGGRVGYDWQCRSLVLGVAADWSWTRLNFNNTFVDPFKTTGFSNNDLSIQSGLNDFGTARARLGWSFTPNWLVYATGGFAFGQVQHSLTWIYNLVPVPPSNVFSAATSNTVTGWVAGGGIEYAFGQWSLRGEALSVTLAGTNLGFSLPPVFAPQPTQNAHFDNTFWVARVGLTYRLNP